MLAGGRYGNGVRDRLADGATPTPNHGKGEADGLQTADGLDVFATTAPEYEGLTHTERYLLDVHGILVLRGAMSPSEVEAARAAIERMRAADGPRREMIEEPALASIATHPRLLPVLLELMEGQPRLVSAGASVKPADTDGHGAAGRRPVGAAQIHCQREYGRDHAHFVVRAPGRIFADNLVCFPYFTDCYEGDGGLLVIP